MPYPLGPVSGDPSLVAEVYQDYSSIESQTYRLGGTIGTLLLLGLAILYLLLLPIARRISKTLTEQNAKLEEQRERLEDMLALERDAQTVQAGRSSLQPLARVALRGSHNENERRHRTADDTPENNSVHDDLLWLSPTPGDTP